MFNLGTGELILIFLVILLLFGAKRLPELARGLGKGINEFKDAVETSKNSNSVGDRPISTQKYFRNIFTLNSYGNYAELWYEINQQTKVII